LDNHVLALGLYFQWYNFACPHKTLSKASQTPAMAAGITDHVWSAKEIIVLPGKSN